MEREFDGIEKISDDDLLNVGGGQGASDRDLVEGADKLVKGVVTNANVVKKHNYLDGNGIYHIVCTECGKEIKSWKPAPGSAYVVGPQICDGCNAKRKNRQKRR